MKNKSNISLQNSDWIYGSYIYKMLERTTLLELLQGTNQVDVMFTGQ